MGIPTWLYYLFGVLMLSSAGYGSVLLVLSLASHRTAGRDVDVSHIFMGIAMAGMFVPAWAFGAHGIWELVFAVLMVWFVVESIQSVQRFGLHVPHALVHAGMSFAMLLMYWFPMGSSSPSVSMSMSGSSGGSHLDSGLAALLALTFFGSAIFTLASPNKGASHHGSHVPAYAVSGAPGSHAPVSPHGGPDGLAGDLEAAVALPWLEDLSHVVMVVGMGFMLILMT
ncbi:MAG: DUF5134 domain-containing protein [Acidimicrobiales bacterium]|jgi:hypothetical protein